VTAAAELDALLAARPEPLRLWWRDDDAGGDHPNLAPLLDLARRHEAPLSLAVIPDRLEPAAAARIAGAPGVTVLQHGIAHRDHARPGERKIELGGAATPDALAAAVVAGRGRLAARFGGAFLPVMVPPWNRIDAAFADRLALWGFTGFSGWRDAGPPSPAICTRLDVHVDGIDRRARRCRGLGELLGDLAALLRAGARGPLGILTHHRDTDEAGFQTLDRLLDLVHTHPGLRMASAAALLREAR
jgi:hypothetical protein